MATSAQIKSDNNTLIRVKTTAKSITKVNVADQLDAGIDYSVQELALKVDKVAGERLINTTEITKLANTSGVNTGDQDLSGKQNVLVSGTNIKTLNGTSILGSGDISVGTPTKTQGNVDAVSGSKATLQYDINTIDKISSSDLKLPTTTEIGKEVLVLASSYNTFINIYANDAQESKLQGGANGVTGTQSSLQIYEREAYRFIYKGDGFWYFEKIIDIPTNLYQEKSERTTDGTLATNSNFKYPTEQAVKTYVNSKIVTKVLKITITQTEISTLHTTGKVLINNTNTTTKIIPLSYYFVKEAGVVYTGDSDIFYILNENNNTYQTINKPFLKNIGGFMVVNSTTNFHSNMSDINTNLILKADAAFTGGTGGFDVYLTYNEITL